MDDLTWYLRWYEVASLWGMDVSEFLTLLAEAKATTTLSLPENRE